MTFEPVRPGLLLAKARKMSQEEWDAGARALEGRLLSLQFRQKESDFPLIVVVSGEDRPGVRGLLARLAGWLDPRHLRVHALGPPTDEERAQPPLWRFWRRLPRKGHFGVFVGGWTARAIVAKARDGDEFDLERALAHAIATEQQWIADGALVLKFWLDVPQRRLAKRMEEEHEERFARFEELDWALATDAKAQRVAKRALRATGTEDAPWHVVESKHRRWRDHVVLTHIADALERRLDQVPRASDGAQATPVEGAPTLSSADLTRRTAPDDYATRLLALQRKLHDLTKEALLAGTAALVVFEGWDAAGKGGAIRRVTAELDPLCYEVSAIGAPTPEECAHHWLWRFWTRLPRPGRMGIFDRSWYGRVLVERVEGFADEPAWRRAYGEIADFEAQLVESGRIVHKFWLHIDPDTQAERFRAREHDALKRYKITEEDYRNRSKWPRYEEAVCDMLARTHSTEAPWQVVAAVSKERARIEVLEALIGRYEQALGKTARPGG